MRTEAKALYRAEQHGPALVPRCGRRLTLEADLHEQALGSDARAILRARGSVDDVDSEGATSGWHAKYVLAQLARDRGDVRHELGCPFKILSPQMKCARVTPGRCSATIDGFGS